jgi:hypothetical protein
MPLSEQPVIGRIGLGRPVRAKVDDLAVDADASLSAVSMKPHLRLFAALPPTHDSTS